MAFPLLKGCLFEGVKVKNNKVGGIENTTTLNQIMLHASFFFLISFFMNVFILIFFFFYLVGFGFCTNFEVEDKRALVKILHFEGM